MGSHPNITAGHFPKQGSHLMKLVEVCFHYDTGHSVPGIVVRDDAEAPWTTIIRVHHDAAGEHYVLASECQYTVLFP